MMAKIIFIDDEPNILSAFRRQLAELYDVTTAGSGEEGIKAISEKGPFAVAVTDYGMPGMNGIQALAVIREKSPDTVRIMLTGRTDLQSAVDAINEGRIFRFLTKPCLPQNLKSTVNDAVDQYRLITAERELLEKTLSGSIKMLTDMLSIANPAAFSRATRLRFLAKRMAANLGMDKPWEAEIAAMLSQAGFVLIPSDTLQRFLIGGELSANEKKMIESLPQDVSRIIGNIPRLEAIAAAVAQQNSPFDGSAGAGRPKGLELPALSRLLKVISDFDSRTVLGRSPDQALREMTAAAGKYDPRMLTALSEVFLRGQGGTEKFIDISEARPGMILSDDVKSQTGALLVAKGTVLNDVLIKRLSNFEASGHVLKAIKVIVPEGEAAAG